MIREIHLTLLDRLLRDANIRSIVPLEGVCNSGLFYDEIHDKYILSGFNISYKDSGLHEFIDGPTDLEVIK